MESEEKVMDFENSFCRAAHQSGASPAGQHGTGSAFEMTCNRRSPGSAFEMARNSRVSALQRQIWQLQLKHGSKFDLPEKEEQDGYDREFFNGNQWLNMPDNEAMRRLA